MVGIDICDLSRITLNEGFINTLLTPEERAQFDAKKTEKRKKEYLGGRFAAKEALYKALQDRNYLHFSILNDETGKPYVKDHPEISVSISHDAGIAAAIVMVRELTKD